MKLHKWLTPILTSTLAITGVSVGLVGCDNGEQPTPPTPPSPPAPQEIANFISDRTFSLMAYSVISLGSDVYYGGFCYGTGWIIDDATPTVGDDYKYHVATNWHVTQGFTDLATEDYDPCTYEGTIYAYADKSSASSATGIIDSYEEYTNLLPGGYVEESDRTTFYYNSTKKEGIDLYETDIDFAKINGQMSQPIKEKLDRINAYRQDKGYINQFVCADKEEIISKTKYIGGYPMKEKGKGPDRLFGGKWETHIVNSDLEYVNKHAHHVSSNLGLITVNDVSPQYESQKDMGTDWMTGGSSGSMLLTEDYEICGIYWGGWGIEGGEEFYPSFSLFNTTSKNFLSKYIH